MSKNSLIVGYAIFLLAGVAITYCHDLSKKSCPVDFKISQTTLGGDTLHHTLNELVCALNRALVTWSPWAPGDNEAVRVVMLHHVNHKFGNKLLPIVCIIEQTTNNICSDVVTAKPMHYLCSRCKGCLIFMGV